MIYISENDNQDITTLNPSPKVKIDLATPEQCSQRLSEELIFKQTRRYGPVEEIILNDKKTSLSVLFTKTSSAISARNCLHQMVIGDSKLLTSYQPYSRLGFLKDFLLNTKILVSFSSDIFCQCHYPFLLDSSRWYHYNSLSLSLGGANEDCQCYPKDCQRLLRS